MSEEKNPLINVTDLTGLKEPLIKLIDTLGGAVKIATQPWVTKRNAKADAEAIGMLSDTLNNPHGEITYNNANFSITVKPNTIEEAAITRMVETEVRRQLNIDSVISKSASILETKETVSDTPVDKDWFNRFLTHIQDITNEDMQNIWAQILASEIEQPNSFSFRTLDFLKSIHPKEANIIQKTLKYAFIDDIDETALIFDGKEGLKSLNIPFLDILLLEELNIAIDGLVLRLEPESCKAINIPQTNDYILLTNTSSSTLNIPVMKLTSLGREILKLISEHSSINDILFFKNHLNISDLKFELCKDSTIYVDENEVPSIRYQSKEQL